MKRALVVAEEVREIGVVQDLTKVFEGIASVRIAKIKDRVVSSKAFFSELWQIYTQLRTDSGEQLTVSSASTGKNVFLVVTSEGGLSGDIDSKIVDRMLKEYDPKHTDIIVLGTRGAILLAQSGVTPTKGFKLPSSDVALDVAPLTTELERYHEAAVFYQTYESLGVQSVARIDLISAVEKQGQESGAATEVISSKDYIFEPSLPEIVKYMRAVVMGLTLSQVILESRLAQLASRFNAMSAAKTRARELHDELNLAYRRAKRAEGDSRLREVITSLRAL